MKRIRNDTRKKKKQNNYTFSIKKGGSRIRITLKDDNYIIRKESTTNKPPPTTKPTQPPQAKTKKQQPTQPTKKQQAKTKKSTKKQQAKKQQATQPTTQQATQPTTQQATQAKTKKSTGELWSAVKKEAKRLGPIKVDEKRKSHVEKLHKIWENISDKDELQEMGIKTAKNIMSIIKTDELKIDPKLKNLKTINKQYRVLSLVVHPDRGIIKDILNESVNTNTERFFNNNINIPFQMVNAANTILVDYHSLPSESATSESATTEFRAKRAEREASQAKQSSSSRKSNSKSGQSTSRQRTTRRGRNDNNSSSTSSRPTSYSSTSSRPTSSSSTSSRPPSSSSTSSRPTSSSSTSSRPPSSSSTSSRPTSSSSTSSSSTSSSSTSSRPTSSRPTSSSSTSSSSTSSSSTSSSSTEDILTNAFKDAKKGEAVARNITSKITKRRLTLDDIVNQSTNVVMYTKSMMEWMKDVKAINNVDTNMNAQKTLAVNTLKEATRSLSKVFNSLNKKFNDWTGTNKKNEIIISFLEQAIEIENAKMTVLEENNTALTNAQVNYVKQILAEIKYSYEGIKGAELVIKNLENPLSSRTGAKDTISDKMDNILDYWNTIDTLEYKDNPEVKKVVDKCEPVIAEATDIFQKYT
jgi:hypothetical protein